VATTICCLVRADTYRDSVDLMRVAPPRAAHAREPGRS